MSSTLATQLQNITAGNALKGSLLHSQKTRASYLFDSKQAAEYDLSTIHSIGVSGLEELMEIDKVFVDFENTIFSEYMKTFDRALQTKEENEKLDKSIGHFLSCLSPYFLIKPAGKALEWLIRRINEFNVNDILTCILPYHETNSFVTMVSILHLNDQWTFLQQIQQKRQPLDRANLIKMCIKDPTILQFICEIVVNSKHPFKTLISFYVAVVIHYIQNVPKLTDNNLTILLPYILKSCKKKRFADLKIGTFMIISQIANKAVLSSDTVSELILRILKSNSQIELHSLLCVVHICQTQASITQFSKRIMKHLQKLPDLDSHLIKISEKYQMDMFLKIFFTSLITYKKIVHEPTLEASKTLLLSVNHAEPNIRRVALRKMIEMLQSETPPDCNFIVQDVLPPETLVSEKADNISSPDTEMFTHEPTLEASTTPLVSVNHEEPDIRRVAIRKMIEMVQSEIPPDCNFIVQDGLPPETLISEKVANISSLDTEIFTLMNLLSSLKKIAGHKINWLKKKEEENESAKLYRTILVDLFNVIITGPDINCTDIIIKQFFVTHFSDDVLQFCCSILVTDDSSDILKIRSLQVANAYIRAYARPEASHQIDFQLIIPTLMSAPINANYSIRKAVLSCLESICSIYEVLWQVDAKQQDVFSSLLDLITSANSYDVANKCKGFLMRVSIPARVVQKELSNINQKLEVIQNEAELANASSKKHTQDQLEEPNAKRARHEYQQNESPDRVLAESAQEETSKKEIAPQTSKHIPPLHRLTTLLELLQCKPKPNIDEISLIASFFELLKTLSKYKSNDRDYVVQLILERLTEIVKISTQKTNMQLYYQINLNIVGDYLLKSRNSQIQNQCLLLMSAVAVTQPTYVLNKIMPLFSTFLEEIGFQRDNEYSNQIVRHAMELVLPVVIEQKEKQSPQKKENSSRAFRAKEILVIFIHAIDHMPKTRIVPFLTTFIQTLGENEFLHAITGLLLSYACTPQREKPKILEIGYISELCLTLMEQFSPEAQIRSAVRLFEELLLLPNNIRHRYKKLTKTHGTPVDDYLFQIYGQTDAEILHLKNVSIKLFKSLFTHDEFLRGLLRWENEEKNYETRIQGLCLNLTEVILKLSLSLEAYQSSRPVVVEIVKEIPTSISDVLFAIHGFVSNTSFVSIIRALLNHTNLKIRSKTITLLHKRLINYESNNNSNDEQPTHMIEILSDLNSLISTNDENTSVENLICKQNALNCLSSFVRRFINGNEELFTQCITPVISEAVFQHQNVNLRISSIACLAQICHEIGLRIIPFLPRFMPQLLEQLQSSLKEQESENHRLLMAILATFEAIFTNVPSFIAPYLYQLLECFLHPVMYQNQHDKEHIVEIYEKIFISIATNIEPRVLLPQISDIYQKAVELGSGSIILLLKLLEGVVMSVKAEVLLDYRIDIFKFLLLPFDYRRMHKNQALEDIIKVEDQTISVFNNFLLKLNEDLFKPLFLWMIDWATTDSLLGTDIDYRLTFLFRLIHHLLNEMKGIFSPYYRSVMDICISKLQDYKEGRRQFDDLWNHIVDSLQKYFMHEENVFETNEQFKKLMIPLVDQLLVPVDQEQYEDRIIQHLMPCLVQLANNLDDLDKLDLLSKQVLLHMQLQTASVQVRLGALRVMREFYEKLGEAFSNFIPEAVPYLVELMEDDDQRVEASNAELIRIIEKLAGQSFDDYLK
ncbi:6163_t:CDS:10 [Ambispora leptoticha]|uniref:U3 small nucleolar RNA-associated protein 10 n=1 Tax=Ambispora leptoticha TaxID=144679 RepID=A0A9N9G3C0_9GLOM|nr:6163_t:CDS:10 [Ambispora leptoticha]